MSVSGVSLLTTSTANECYLMHYDFMHFSSMKKYPGPILETYRNQKNCILIFCKNYKATKKLFTLAVCINMSCLVTGALPPFDLLNKVIRKK